LPSSDFLLTITADSFNPRLPVLKRRSALEPLEVMTRTLDSIEYEI
jgi:hypothetical protein